MLYQLPDEQSLRNLANTADELCDWTVTEVTVGRLKVFAVEILRLRDSLAARVNAPAEAAVRQKESETCATCDQMMGQLASCEHTDYFYCDRCGTALVVTPVGKRHVYVPSLVGRVRAFRDYANDGQGLIPSDARLWHRIGIAESIAVTRSGVRPDAVTGDRP